MAANGTGTAAACLIDPKFWGYPPVIRHNIL
jgi:hypothetical protein